MNDDGQLTVWWVTVRGEAWGVRLDREDGQWAVHCPSLGVASCGATRVEALDNVRDAIGVYLETVAAG